ncbi:uncharacterized protein [Nicotiana sylvestris]|uniref:Uncharacterized protein LOC104246324 isoform X1 n=1 Tax=Nicotiana sylvestris TaxID=4096 RepID=A0A1U7YEQ1_NICSY|nr:PREDICTED: uncharacterized protein LOC104246324 isoform X1 [Nicotiana sylvestris]XP_009800431.1 PREDICTED: uncharacterized protein LOC104246324 isoform X1 [Nicotiana sylvestris]XP_009800432.1 PREDICTED: uncharacterized protein LOC104246324 isoform X1 [Nicotiana sylvestris]
MARKGSRQKYRKGVSYSGSGLVNENENSSLTEPEGKNAEPFNGNLSGISLTESFNNTHESEGKKRKHKSRRSLKKEKEDIDTSSIAKEIGPEEGSGAGIFQSHKSRGVAPESREGGETSPHTSHRSDNSNRSFGQFGPGLDKDNILENFEVSIIVVFRNLMTLALSVSKASIQWLERWKPLLDSLRSNLLIASKHVEEKVQHAYPIVVRWIMHSLFIATGYVQERVQRAYPIVVRWIMHFGNIIILLSMVWLDCALRGIESFLCMGMTSILSVIWWGVLSLIAAAKFKFLLILATVAVIGLLTGFIIAVLGVAAVSISYLWFYGRFWAAVLLVLSGGVLYRLKHERLAVFVVNLYSVYCAWTYVGWLGLIFGLNLSFVSSDILIFFLRNNVNDYRRPNSSPDQTTGVQGEPSFYSGGSVPPSAADVYVHTADRGTGIPSTSGFDTDMTSEDEVLRLLNSTDHYSALGLSRFQNIDASVLKKEYRKKAMLVHPDKNMGNEKAAEAFKKLQNAYEVLLDSLKRKAYDDELRREELLDYLRRFQSPSQKGRGYGFFTSGFTQTEAAAEDSLADARRITCKKCGNFHVWVFTKKTKSKARWCQECNDFHPAKDGDGWVEQPSHPFFFGMLLKVDNPVAYVCADSRIYNATEWYICQGMRCPVNSHKPSFHVNTSVTMKSSNGKRSSSGQRGPSVEETMTEEEFVEWLQNAVQSGTFGDFDGSTPQRSAGNSTSNNASGSGSGSKRKKKGKKQW